MNSSSTAAAKIDLKKEHRSLYTGKAGVVTQVTPGAHLYLCVHGSGDPNTSADYKSAVEALFSVSYAVKFAARKECGKDYGVMPLEGLWWSDDMSVFQPGGDRSQWRWTMMIMQPSFITAALVEAAKVATAKKKGINTDGLSAELYEEGTSAQILHVGPFAEEGPAIAKLHEWIGSNGHSATGKHHEIYLSDIRRGSPAAWKTLIRQPFQ